MADTNLVGNTWEIGLCEIGECGHCMFACCCPGWALAESRTLMDGSDCLFNALFVSPCVTTWLIKSAYGIPQDFYDDLKCLCFCMCCHANRVYQTVRTRRNPTTDGGLAHNTNKLSKDCCPPAEYCNAKSLLCCYCEMATALNKHLGMEWWFALCCNSPFAGANILRYQYRLVGNDNQECWCAYFKCCPCFLVKMGKIFQEADKARPDGGDRYLVRPTPSAVDAVPTQGYDMDRGIETTQPVVVTATVADSGPSDPRKVIPI